MAGKIGEVFNRGKALVKDHLPSLINFFSLGFLRATDALVQLLLLPIIIHRVGIHNYGIIAFVLVWLNYGKTIINYGLMISGVRDLALAGKDPERMAGIFWKFFFTKGCLALIYLMVLIPSVTVIYHFGEKAGVFYWGTAVIIGNLFFFDWFFIGLQKAHLIALANLISKILFAVLVLILVREAPDFKLILAYQGIADFLVGVTLLALLRIYYLPARIIFPGLKTILQVLKEDFRLLYTNFILEFNATSSIIMVNILTTDTLTGYFTVMYKLIQPLRFLLVIFSQTIFPVVCQKIRQGWDQATAYLQKAFLYFLGLPLLGIAASCYFADLLLTCFAGSVATTYTFEFRLFLLVPFIILFNIPAFQLLLAYNRKKEYAAVHIVSLLMKVLLDYSLIKWFQLRGAVMSVMVVELFITLGLYVMLLRIKNDQLNNIG